MDAKGVFLSIFRLNICLIFNKSTSSYCVTPRGRYIHQGCILWGENQIFIKHSVKVEGVIMSDQGGIQPPRGDTLGFFKLNCLLNIH